LFLLEIYFQLPEYYVMQHYVNITFVYFRQQENTFHQNQIEYFIQRELSFHDVLLIPSCNGTCLFMVSSTQILDMGVKSCCLHSLQK